MHGNQRILTLIIIAAGLLLTGDSYAIKADYIEFTINGRVYNVPIPNTETKNTFYYIKKALAGDQIARELVLGGCDKKQFFIGDVGLVRWLTITKDSESVVEIPITK